jgi:hypothetical protein
MKPRSKTIRPCDRATVRPCDRVTVRSSDRATVRLTLTVPETLLAKLRLASPSGDPAAAALSFLLERFKQPTRRPRT